MVKVLSRRRHTAQRKARNKHFSNLVFGKWAGQKKGLLRKELETFEMPVTRRHFA